MLKFFATRDAFWLLLVAVVCCGWFTHRLVINRKYDAEVAHHKAKLHSDTLQNSTIAEGIWVERSASLATLERNRQRLKELSVRRDDLRRKALAH